MTLNCKHSVSQTAAEWRDLFYTLKEAQVPIADWRRLYNGLRPHRSLGNRPPAPETIVWQGFALADWGPPTLTPEPSMRLS